MDTSIINSMKTILEMIKDRQYNVNIEAINETLITDSFIQKSKSKPGIMINVDNKVMIIYQILKDKVDMPSLKKFLDEYNEIDLDVILITQEKLLLKQLEDLKLYQKNISSFQLKELQINITKHFLVPKHEKVPKKDEQEILDFYNLKSKTQLPLILKTDPMSRYLGLQSGDLVKITRNNSPSSGEYVIYRCCV